LFWYALPPIFIFIVGDGAVEFVRLFFDRTQRLDAWREAVASTYRNHVIVLGAGHVGLRVIQILRDELDVDVVALDTNPSAGVEEFLAERRVPLLRGNGTQSAVLEKAGLKDAEAFIACTGDDHTNLDAIMRARGMNRNVRIVARVWDDQFATQIKDFMNVQSVLSSSEVSAPVFAGMALGVEITQSISIGDTNYSTLRLNIRKDSFLDGQTVGSVQQNEKVDVVLHCAIGHLPQVQPSHETVLKADDILVIFGHEERCLQVATRNHFNR
ncbi:MAG: TrkA family potassium uptake protein, partial [Anaerolineae bacterium]|nr:TrkA family potassium uptake protein [Anaerolineae bacterium]